MTKPQRWPVNAENARMECVALAYRILRGLAEMDRPEEMSYAEIVLRARDAQASAGRIIQMLNGARDGQAETEEAPGTAIPQPRKNGKPQPHHTRR